MNWQLSTRHSLLGRLGSFWNDMMIGGPGEALVRRLVHLPDHANTLPTFAQAVERAAGSVDLGEVGYPVVPFKAAQVDNIGALLNARSDVPLIVGDGPVHVFRRSLIPDTGVGGHMSLHEEFPNQGVILQTEAAEYLLMPTNETVLSSTPALDVSRLRFVLPWPENLFPAALITAARELVAGVDFWIGAGCLVFLEDPRKLWPDGQILCAGGRLRRMGLRSFVLRQTLPAEGVHISRYLRAEQGPARLQAAAAEIAGLAVWPRSGYVTHRLDSVDGRTFYKLDGGALVVADYPHTPVEPGTRVTSGDVVGNVLQVRARGAASSNWWRSWFEDGRPLVLPAGAMGSVRFVPVPSLIRADSAPTDAHYHVTFEGIQGSPRDIAAWHYALHRSERQTGFWLNTMLGLAAGEVVSRDPVEVLFSAGLSENALLVEIDRSSIDFYREQLLLNFLRREKPAAGVLLVTTTGES